MTKTGKLADIWPKLTTTQKQYVAARQTFGTKADAARHAGVAPATIYKWPDFVEEAVELYTDQMLEAAFSDLQHALSEAVRLKIEEMNHTDPKIASAARTEVIDRAAGKASQHITQEVTQNVSVSDSRVQELEDKLKSRALDLTGLSEMNLPNPTSAEQRGLA